jgi:hypothetical protein
MLFDSALRCGCVVRIVILTRRFLAGAKHRYKYAEKAGRTVFTAVTGKVSDAESARRTARRKRHKRLKKNT